MKKSTRVPLLVLVFLAIGLLMILGFLLSHQILLIDGIYFTLFFWAITCSPCVKELPVIQRFSVQHQATGKQMVVLGVNIDEVDNFVKVAALHKAVSPVE